MQDVEQAVVTWEPPGPGPWAFDRVHYDHPTTGFSRGYGPDAFKAGFAEGFALCGAALSTPEVAWVNGWQYGQRLPSEPSSWPTLERAAQVMLDGRGWRDLGRRWFDVHRPEVLGRCHELQAEPVAELADDRLAAHLLATTDLMATTQRHHFRQISLTFVVGELLSACGEWGVGVSEATSLLAGSSPATSAAAEQLGEIARAVAAAGVTAPRTLDDIRVAGADAARALDDYLAIYGWRVCTGFDVDNKALVEMPEVVVTSVLAAGRPTAATTTSRHASEDAVRARIPEDQRERFDDLLAEARFVYSIRDDDVGPVMWSRGLARRTLLESGARLAGRGAIRSASDIFEATPAECVDLLAGRGPAATELAARSALRARQGLLTPPDTLGPAPSAPTLDGMPPAVRGVTKALLAYLNHGRPSSSERLRGSGIGTSSYRGRARVVRRAEDALDRLEPGDVLITSMTTPAFNGVMSIAGALVVQEGGLMTHAAIMARELGLPAVVGVAGVLDDVADGDEVEVDPVAGEVRILRPA